MCRTRSFAYSSAHTQHSGEGLGFGGGGGGAVRPRGECETRRMFRRRRLSARPPRRRCRPALPPREDARATQPTPLPVAPTHRGESSPRSSPISSPPRRLFDRIRPERDRRRRSASPLRVTCASLRGRLRHLRAFRAFRRRPRAFGPHAPFHLRLAFQILEERRRRRSERRDFRRAIFERAIRVSPRAARVQKCIREPSDAFRPRRRVGRRGDTRTRGMVGGG